MPELPEVQTVVDHLTAEGLIGQQVCGVEAFWSKTIALSSVEDFCRRLKGRCIKDIRRRAKYIIFVFEDDQSLLIHLRMTGRLQLTGMDAKPSSHVHVILQLGDQRRLLFHDTRKFGRLYLTRNPQTILGKLGPEPLEKGFTARIFTDKLHHRKRQIKPLLLDQAFLAGLGNIYVDEALWASSIHPLRRADTLSRLEAKSLHRSIRRVLRQGIRNAGTSLGNGQGNFASPDRTRGRNRSRLNVFRRTGNPCPRCGHPIVRLTVAQRSSHICARCQQV